MQKHSKGKIVTNFSGAVSRTPDASTSTSLEAKEKEEERQGKEGGGLTNFSRLNVLRDSIEYQIVIYKHQVPVHLKWGKKLD